MEKEKKETEFEGIAKLAFEAIAAYVGEHENTGIIVMGIENDEDGIRFVNGVKGKSIYLSAAFAHFMTNKDTENIAREAAVLAVKITKAELEDDLDRLSKKIAGRTKGMFDNEADEAE